MDKEREARRAELKQRFLERKKQREDVPFTPPPKPPLVPAFTPENTALSNFIKEQFPKFDLIGPRREKLLFKGARDEQNVFFVEGDLTDNGLTDYIGVIRSKHHEDIAYVVAFLQKKEGQFKEKRLPIWFFEFAQYLKPTTVGYLRERYKTHTKGREHTSLYDSQIPDERFAILVGHVAGSEYGFFMSKKGPCPIKFGC